MKLLLLFIVFISCSNPEQEIKYIPKGVVANDTLTKLINDARIENGFNSLVSESLLIELSKVKAIQMESDKEVNHNGFSSLQTNAKSYAQIVGYGYGSEARLFNAYLNSNEHNYILLGDFTHIGSYTINGYNCVIFAKY